MLVVISDLHLRLRRDGLEHHTVQVLDEIAAGNSENLARASFFCRGAFRPVC